MSWFSGKKDNTGSGSSVKATVSLHEAELQGRVDAINRVQAVITFRPDGTILSANENFLNVLGYRMDEIKGKHHSMFVEPEYARSHAYEQFWQTLRSGAFESGEFKRIGKGGKVVWLLASYNPVFDAAGKLLEVTKFATDITAEKMKNADFQGQIEAIHRTQAIIEFDLDGKILTANHLFLALMGYTLDEVQGRHHGIFLEPGQENTAEYREFWKSLRSGRAESRVFKRIGKNGKVVWIQASYNPILDPDGRPFKVVKFASDLSTVINQTDMSQHTAQIVASATEQMKSSIAEIGRNVDLARKTTNEILSTSTESSAEATRLMDSMRSMENIVGMIRGIASQVNMLALNATIEAARAGEAGKGFAVVATEVKSLSDQTAKATNQIDKEIGSIQSVSAKVAGSIRQTLEGVTEINHHMMSVAAAMEEQTSATGEIAAQSTRLVKAVEEIMDQTVNRNNAQC